MYDEYDSESPPHVSVAPPAPEPPSADDSRGGGAAQGALWTTLGHGGAQAIRLANNLIMTRLLAPEDFGVMLIVTTIYIGLHLFSDVGLGASLIHNDREDERFQNTAWTIEAIRGLVVAAGLLIAAPFVASVYHTPLLAKILPVTAAVAIIESLSSTRYATHQRHLHLKPLVALSIGSQLFAVVVMIAWAVVSPTIWALVAGQVAKEVVFVIGTHTLLPGLRNRFTFDKTAAREFLHFGRWIVLSTMLGYLASTTDRFVFGKLIGVGALLGVYSIAAVLAGPVSDLFASLAYQVLFPYYARMRREGQALGEAFREARWPLLVIGGWISAGIVAGGPTIVRMLYSPEYYAAGWMLQILATGVWFGIACEQTNMAGILALGESRWTAVSAASKLIGLVVFIPVGWHLAGFPGAVAGFAVGDLVRYGVSAYAASRLGLRGYVQDAKIALRGAVSIVLCELALRMLTMWVDFVVLDAVVIFVVTTIVWLDWLWPIAQRVRGGASPFRPKEEAA
ncbi:MAG: oligosaccharide flippase family protein [Myxococcales bacterium]|nr:oligosaccharide flippase family protein [Myxococcales bacterium]